MSTIAEEFFKVDKETHSRMQGAIKNALLADFKVEEAPKQRKENSFSKKPLEFFVREKIDPDLVNNIRNQVGEAEASESSVSGQVADTSTHSDQETETNVGLEDSEQAGAGLPKDSADLDELTEVLASNDQALTQLDSNSDSDSLLQAEEAVQSENYNEGFAAGRAAALSELEEQRLENLEVLKSISEKLLTDSCFDFDNISTKVLDTVNELSSERCGIEIDQNPEGFLSRIDKKIDQVRNLSKDRCVFFNELDLKSLKCFDEFEKFFSDAKVRSDPQLKRGDVIVKIGGVELRDAPFSDYEEGFLNE